MSAPVWASDVYVSPNAPSGGDGSQSHPFASVMAALRRPAASGGDRIFLQSGEYGDLLIKDARFSKRVDLIAPEGVAAHFGSVVVNNSSHLHISGLQIWPLMPEPSHSALVQTFGNATNITFDRLDLRSSKNAGGYMSWSESKWLSLKRGGVLLRGARNTISNSQLTGFYIAISTIGPQSRIHGNRIMGFSGDGMRALGDNTMVSANFVENCFQVDGNHADGFQSWSLGPDGKPGTGTVKGLTIEGNFILEWNGPKRHPLRCSLQGIGLFDGMFDNLTIQNNVVSGRAYHGITVTGATNSSIINNTVVNADVSSSGQPWIGVFAHKGGTASRQVIVANNTAMAYRLPDHIKSSTVGNITMDNAARFLNDPSGLDFRPKANGSLIDAGYAKYAPRVDIMGTQRPQGSQPDIGAFELR